MGKVLLAVDLSYQSYRASAAHKNLSSRRIFTGGLYGFFTTWSKMMRETRATHVAFCMDRKPYKRSEIYPQYKELRKANRDDELLLLHRETMELLLKVFEESGLQVWGVDGFESDDLIAHCVMKYRNRFDMIYAASNDSDLYQLLWADNFALYTSDIKSLMTGERLKAQGITPAEHTLATALTGTHNDVEGIRGVGPVTALKAVRDVSLMRKYRADHGVLIDRNLQLIKLPHPEFPDDEQLPIHQGKFNPRRLYSSLGYYDIDVTSSMVNAFEQLLRR